MANRMLRFTSSMSRQLLSPEPAVNADFFSPDPHLSDAINRNMIQSEIEGGVHLDRLLPGDKLQVETRDWICDFEYCGEYRAIISGHPVYCPEPVEVNVAGSTWGGSLLKLHFIGRGMHLEFLHPVYQRVVTSRIAEIRQI